MRCTDAHPKPVEGDVVTCFLKVFACAKQMRMPNCDLRQARPNPVKCDVPACFLKAYACAKQMRTPNCDLRQAHPNPVKGDVPTCLLKACACAKQILYMFETSLRKCKTKSSCLFASQLLRTTTDQAASNALMAAFTLPLAKVVLYRAVSDHVTSFMAAC